MPDIAQLLKNEISRLARKEIRMATDPLQEQLIDLRRTVREQRKTIAKLHQHVAQLQALATSPTDKILEASNIESGRKIHLAPASIKNHRKRLGLSQGQLGQLLKVSTNTIVRWEQGKSKPRKAYRTGIAQLRTMGVRQVKKLLAASK